MNLTLWRYSHFALAVSSCLFVFLAAVTGAVLAFQPVQTKMRGYAVPGSENISVSHLIKGLQSRYDEVLGVEVDANYFVKASVFSMDEALDGDFYVDPQTGEKIGDLPEESAFFDFFTSMHRSLFLKTPGRIFVGVNSFLLFLIAFSGTVLILKRQRGIKNFFNRIVKEDFYQYFHVVLGRLTLIPIVIITLTGVYLSLERFELIPAGTSQIVDNEISTEEEQRELAVIDFPVFKKTKLSEIRKLEFPFSPDPEEFYILGLKDRELRIHQQTGAVISEKLYPFAQTVSGLSFNLHTGQGSIIWSLILAISSLNILFFMYSGAMISWRRLRSRSHNKYSADECEVIVLTGSENGSTKRFGSVLQESIQQFGKKVFLGDLNQYRSFPKMEQLLVLTSTYGDGDPPSNAGKFIEQFQKESVRGSFEFSVVGFGSRAYSNFCKYALDVNSVLSGSKGNRQLLEPYLIHNKNYSGFKKWTELLAKEMKWDLKMPNTLIHAKHKTHAFTVLEKQVVNDSFDTTFVLKIRPRKRLKFSSGDLLAVHPPGDAVERLYSIGKDAEGNILLSVKKHEMGLCSGFLYGLEVNTVFRAHIQRNSDFHLPHKASGTVLIANGTGIGPFLGMMDRRRVHSDLHLYWGGRTVCSYGLYEEYFNKALENGSLKGVKIACSREEGSARYVQDLLKEDRMFFANHLKTGGSIMICGSVTMQRGVLECLDQLSNEFNHKPLSYYLGKGQLLMDCY